MYGGHNGYVVLLSSSPSWGFLYVHWTDDEDGGRGLVSVDSFRASSPEELLRGATDSGYRDLLQPQGLEDPPCLLFADPTAAETVFWQKVLNDSPGGK